MDETNNLIEALIESTDQNSDETRNVIEANLQQNARNGGILEQQLEVQDNIISELRKDKTQKVKLEIEEEDKDELATAFFSMLKGKKGDKGEKGDKGDKGDTGEALTFEMLTEEQKLEIKGDKGDTGEKGEKGLDGKNGLDGKDGTNGLDGKDGKNGKDGKDGSPDTPAQVKEKLLEAGIDYTEIQNTPDVEEISLNTFKRFRQASKTTSLVELDDVDYSGLSFVNGKYILGSGSGGGAFIDLTDVPNSYVGQAGKVVTVKGTEDGLEFTAGGGTGTVTSIATAGLISGGTITTTGTITTSMATNKLVGRGTAGTGVMEEITLGTGLSLTGTTLNATAAITGSDTQVLFFDGANNPAGDAGLTYNKTTDVLTVAGSVLTPEVKATSSAGVDIHNNSGTQVALFGAGGGTGSSLVGTTNIGSASADYIQVSGGTGATTLTATGSSSNIDITAVPKGTGKFKVTGDVNISGLTASKVVFTDASKNLTSTGIGTSSQFIKGDGSLDSATYADSSFKTIAVSGQSDVVADSASDTLTLAAGSNITITTNAGTDTITIAASGGGGLTNWTEAYTSSTQATSDFTAIGAGAAINAALVAKGTGATVAQVPDGTATAGNSRGQYATDWQKVRNTNDMVASGNYSTIGGGERNKVVGSWATVPGGYNNRAASSSSTVGGGESNNLSAGSAGTIAGGSSNSSTADYATIGGGISNQVTGSRGTVVGGDSNVNTSYAGIVGGLSNTTTAGGYYAVALGYANTISGYPDFPVAIGRGNAVSATGGVSVGYSNTSSARSAVTIGESNTASASYTNSIGFYADAHLQGEATHASGRFAAVGDAQQAELIWRRQITGTSATELFLDGASIQAILKSSNASWSGTITVNATLKTVGNGAGAIGDMFGGQYFVCISRVSTTTALKGTIQTIATSGNMTAGVVTITADDTTEALKITFTPDTAFAGSTTVTNVVAFGTLAETRV